MTRRDIYDDEPWSKMDDADLRNHVARGFTLEETAAFLCRAGTPLDVARRAKELGLTWHQRGRQRGETTIEAPISDLRGTLRGA
jgi:ribosomal protein L13E